MTPLFPPGPANDLLGWRHIASVRQDLVGFAGRLQREYGDVSHFRLGPMSVYLLTHPGHIQEVLSRQAKKFRKPTRLKQVFGRFEGNGLVVSDGPLWSRQRRVVQPAFQPDRLPGYADAITELTSRMLDGWGPRTEVEIAAEVRRLTLRIVARTLFSTPVEEEVERIGRAVEVIQDWSMREMNRLMATPSWLPLFGQPKARRAIAFLDGLVRRILRERRASPGQDDLLGRLLAAVDVEGDGQGMPDRQLRDEMVTLLLAGHETSAAALTWAAWLLACHPEIQARVADEVRGTLGTRAPTFSDLAGLSAVEQVFKEALRLYPPVYFFSREAAQAASVAGYEMQPGSQVFLCPYLTQRDPRWFPSPERFDPLRFASENEARLPACAWFPFGAGPRACVGRAFALMEGTLILACLLQRYRVERPAGEADPELVWQLSLHPRVSPRLIARQDAVR